MHRYPNRRLQSSRYHSHSRRRDDAVVPATASSGDDAPVQGGAASPRVRRRRWLLLAGVPLAILTLLIALIVPTLLRVRTAYGQIFVTPMSHLQVVDNGRGTPVIVAPGAASAFASPAAPAGTPGADLGQPGDRLPSPTASPLDRLPNWDRKDRVNILLLGVDANPARQSQGEPPLSDTIIIVSINPATKTVSMLSIPRDLLVTIPNYGPDKINAAFADGEVSGLGGPALVRATIEYNFHFPIHYFAEVDLAGFEKIVDTLGGVTIDVRAPLKDDQYPGDHFDYLRFYFQTGLQHLDGATALHYARSRHDDNDFARGDRQQQVLEALREQAVSLGLIGKAPQLVTQLGGTVKTDLSPQQVLALAKLASTLPADSVKSYNLFNATTVQWLPGQPYYLIPQWLLIQQLLSEINAR